MRWMGLLSLAAMTAGCAQTTPPGLIAVNSPPAPTTRPAPAAEDSVKAPAINVFGELDGVDHGPAMSVAEIGVEQHTFHDEGFDSDVAVDPSCKWIMFASTRHSVHPNLYLQKIDGMSVIQLTNDDADYAYPTFSPDGQRIAFCATRGGQWNVYLADLDGRNMTQVTNGTTQDVHPTFSPDGSRLAYSSLGARSGQWELWVVDLTNGRKQMIGFGLFPSWSPQKDVDRIAFQRARQRGSRRFSLWTLDLVDGEARQITEVAVSANAAIVSPRWSPDGSKLAFSTITDPGKTVGDKPAGQEDIWVVNSDGSDHRRLTDGLGENLSPFWAMDNRIFFISDRGGSECVWSVRAGAPPKSAVANIPVVKPRDTVGATDTRDIGR